MEFVVILAWLYISAKAATWLFAFVGMALADVAWVFCIRRVHSGQAVQAGLYSVGIFLPIALTQLGYVNDPWLLIPAALGHFCGTYATVKWDSEKNG